MSHALAAALIVAVMLIGVLHAPVWAVLVGCSLAFACSLARAWHKARSG
jgi:hypothetical protein